MATLLPISTILQIADIGQYLAADDIKRGNKLKSGFLAPNLALQIFNTKTIVRWVYTLNPVDSSLTQTSTYLLQLLGGYVNEALQIINNQTISPPVITGPSNQSVLVGATATFSVSVSGTAPFSYQWYVNGIIISGATSSSYSKTNTQLTDSGEQYSVKVTGPSGVPVFSNTATLTVATALTANTWYGNTDPGPTLQANIDNFAYQIATTITHNNPISIVVPQAATPNMYFVTRVPIGESIKTTYYNTALNNGTIPDFNYQNYIQFNGYTYYYTRQAVSWDYTQPLILS